AKSGAGEVVIRVGWIDLREGDKNLAVKIANTEWRVIGWNIWIGKRESALENKASVVGLDLVGMKIRHIKIILTIGDTECRAFINSVARAVVDRFESLSVVQVRVPAGNRSIFADKDEFGGQRVCAVADFENRRRIPRCPCRIRAVAIGRTRRNRNDERIA